MLTAVLEPSTAVVNPVFAGWLIASMVKVVPEAAVILYS